MEPPEHNAGGVVHACPKLTMTFRCVRRAACVLLVLDIVTCSAEAPANGDKYPSEAGEPLTANSGVGLDVSAELVLKDLMLWMRDNHGVAHLLHPKNSAWLEHFSPRGTSGEHTVALSFALRSALSREMEKAAMLLEGFDAAPLEKDEESSSVAEREHASKELEDLHRLLSSTRAEADKRQRALEEELREEKRAHDEVQALYEAALLTIKDEVHSGAQPVNSGGESSVDSISEAERDIEIPPLAEDVKGINALPLAEEVEDVSALPRAEEAEDINALPRAEEAEAIDTPPRADEAAIDTPPLADEAKAIDTPPLPPSAPTPPDHHLDRKEQLPMVTFSPPDDPTPVADRSAGVSKLKRIVTFVKTVATKIVGMTYPIFELLANWVTSTSLGFQLSRRLDATASKLEMMTATFDSYLGTSLAKPGTRFRTAVEISLAVATLVALLTLRWIARAWYNWTFKQHIAPKGKETMKKDDGETRATRNRTGGLSERSDGGGPVAGAQGYHSSETLRRRPQQTHQVQTQDVPMQQRVPMQDAPTQQRNSMQQHVPTQWHQTPAGNSVLPHGPTPAPVTMRRGPPPRMNPVFKPRAS